MAKVVLSAASNNGGGTTSITMTMPGNSASPYAPNGSWTHNNVPTGTYDSAIVRGADGIWVTIGGAGKIYWTTDPFGTWTSNTQGTNDLEGLDYGNGVWVVTGVLGQIWVANDPRGTWTNKSVGGSNTLSQVTYGAGYWVAAGDNGALYYATDPFGTWTSNFQGTVTFTTTFYGNGYWVVAGVSGALYYKLTDPTGSWTSNTQGTLTFQDVAYRNGFWVVVGNTGALFYKATDPTGAWTSNTQGTDAIGGVEFANGYWLAVQSGGVGGQVLYTTDPTGAWSTQTGIAAGDFYEGVWFWNGYWFVTGGNSGSAIMMWLAVLQDGDILAMGVTVRGGTGTTITDPAGWTLLGSQVNSTTVLAQKLYWRVAATEPTSYAVTITSNKASGVIVLVRDGTTTVPPSTMFAGQANASSATITYPALGTFTPVDGVDLVFGGTAASSTTAAPSTYTETATSGSTGGSAGSRTQSENAWVALAAASTVASKTATWGTAAVNIGHHLFIAASTPPNAYRTPMPMLLAQ